MYIPVGEVGLDLPEMGNDFGVAAGFFKNFALSGSEEILIGFYTAARDFIVVVFLDINDGDLVVLIE